jgi:TonB family protein
MPNPSNSEWRIIPLLIVLPWLAVFIAYQTGLIARVVSHFDQSWAASDPQGLSMSSRVSVELFRNGACDSGLFLLKWIDVGTAHSPYWVQGKGVACLETSGRDEEASRLLGSRCADVNQPGEVIPAFRVNPFYPLAASTDGVEGWVELNFDIADDGRVSRKSIEASVPSGIFDRASLEAVAQWRYCPGTPATNVRVRLKFELGS